jgi:hypothetical protein
MPEPPWWVGDRKDAATQRRGYSAVVHRNPMARDAPGWPRRIAGGDLVLLEFFGEVFQHFGIDRAG